MTLDFPLILVIGTLLTGLIWLLDIVILRPRRKLIARQAGQVDDETLEEYLRQPRLVEFSVSIFPVLALVLVFRSFLFEPFQIPSASMYPTLFVGDFILVNKYHYGIRLPVSGTKIFDVNTPENGDVMVFIPPHTSQYFIKRVVGIPGDHVQYRNKTLTINGVKQRQTFVSRIPPVDPEYLQFTEQLGHAEHLIQVNTIPDSHLIAFMMPYGTVLKERETEWEVPEGHYFMMGDNRDQSSDSRIWGPVPESNIVGKAVAVWLHKEPGLRLPELSRNGWIK